MVTAVVLAAGLSIRMGRPKQTLQVEGSPMLEKVLMALRQSKVDRVVVVLGAHADEVRKNVKFVDEKVVINPRYAEGMSRSLKLGLGEVKGDTEAVIIALGDQPFVSAETIDRLVDAYRASKARIVVPVYRGRRGNPVLFDKSMFQQIMGIQGDVGARSVVTSNEEKVLEVVVNDRGVLVDIDTLSDFAKTTAIRLGRSRAGA